MAFDSVAFAPAARPLDLSSEVDVTAAPCPQWTRENPDRALALLFVSPVDCTAVDVLVSLPAKA